MVMIYDTIEMTGGYTNYIMNVYKPCHNAKLWQKGHIMYPIFNSQLSLSLSFSLVEIILLNKCHHPSSPMGSIYLLVVLIRQFLCTYTEDN